MRKWALSAVITLIPIVCLLVYFYSAIQRAVCLESVGLWLGLYKGCDLVLDEGYYSLTISPISVAIFVVVWLLVVWLVSLVLKRFQVFNKN